MKLNLSPKNVKKYVTIPNILIGGGIGLVGLLAYKYATTGNLDIFGGQQQGKPHAEFSIFPAAVRPGDTATISGKILDANNNPITIPTAFYQITNNLGQIIISGSLGNNVSTFTKVITIPEIPEGGFKVEIVDELTPTNRVSNNNAGGPTIPLPLPAMRDFGVGGTPPQGDPYYYGATDIGNNTMQPLPSLAPQNTRQMLSQLTPSGPPQTSNYIAPRALNDFQHLDNNFIYHIP